MSVSGVPNIRVIIREPDDENMLLDVPTLTVRVLEGDSYNVNVTPPVTVTVRTGSYNSFADVAILAYTASFVSGSNVIAGFATSASFAQTASYALNTQGSGFPFSGSAVITGSLLVIPTGSVGGVTASLLGTASIAENITIISAGIYETSSDSPIIPTPAGGLSYITSASYALSASYAATVGSVEWNTVTNKPTGIISSSAQISQSGFVSSSTVQIIQTITSASYAAITPVSGTLYIIIN